MKLGIFTVSMPDYEPLEALKVAAELGYDGLEWRICADNGDRSKPGFWSGNRSSMSATELLKNAEALRTRAAELKLEMPSLGTYMDSHDLVAVEEAMKSAVALGAKALRVGPGRYVKCEKTYQQIYKEARERYARVAELAAKHKVRALIETHMGQLGPSVGAARGILEGLSPSDVGIMWDPGNQVDEGLETYPMALDIAGPYLAEVHVKNRSRVQKGTERGQTLWEAYSCPIQSGVVNWPLVLDELKKVGYEGWLFFEDFSTDLPLRERLTANIRWFRELLS